MGQKGVSYVAKHSRYALRLRRRDGVEDLAQAMERRSPLVFWSGKESLDALPLSI
jgi:hypothetical protein